MKKIILLSVTIFLLILGCSKDDDGPTGGTTKPSTDLIGIWELDYYIENGALTEEIICDELVEFVFLTNGNYTETTFSGEETSNCVKAVQINGTWADLGSNNYELTPNGGIAGPTLSITFHDNFTKFIFEVNTNRTEVYTKH